MLSLWFRFVYKIADVFACGDSDVLFECSLKGAHIRKSVFKGKFGQGVVATVVFEEFHNAQFIQIFRQGSVQNFLADLRKIKFAVSELVG